MAARIPWSACRSRGLGAGLRHGIESGEAHGFESIDVHRRLLITAADDSDPAAVRSALGPEVLVELDGSIAWEQAGRWLVVYGITPIDRGARLASLVRVADRVSGSFAATCGSDQVAA